MSSLTPQPLSPASSRLARGWATLRTAVAGSSDEDFTRGPIGRAVFLLSVPMVLEMAMESVFAIVDVFFVSRLGADAVAVIGINESILTLVYAVALGLSMATTAMVSRRIGEKKPEEAAVVAVQTVVLGLVVAAMIGIPGALYGDDLLRLMGISEDTVRLGSRFQAIMLGGSGTVLLLFLINAVFRGAGDAAVAMRALWIGNAVNIVLDPCLIFGLGPFPELGLTGAAVATTTGRGIGVCYQLWMLTRGRGRIRVARRHLRIESRVILRLAKLSVGGMFQYLVATGSWLALMRIVSLFGSTAVAGYTIAIRIIVFSILPAWGMSNAAATLMGQNLGAGQPDRAAASVWRTGLYNMAFLVGVAVVFLALPETLVGLFTSDPAVLHYGATCLRIVSYGYAFYAWGMVMVQAFNGAGDTATPTAINLFSYWIVQIPLAWALSRGLGFGVEGAFWAIPIAESILTVTGILAFRRGTWRTRTV